MLDERHLSFKARLENISAACDFVAQAAESAGLDERGVYHCQLAVDEACTNIIQHGFTKGPENRHGQINLTTGVADDNSFVVVISDNGPAFNPLVYQEPDPGRNLEDREGGGWGIYFIKKLMDFVDYRYTDGKNHLTLHKYIDGESISIRQNENDSISIERQTLEKDYLLLKLSGQIDSHTSSYLEAALEAELNQKDNFRLVISFANVNYISSSGLKVLVSAWRKAREQDGDVLITNLQPRIREVFEMIGFDMMFNIYPTPSEAVTDDPIGK